MDLADYVETSPLRQIAGSTPAISRTTASASASGLYRDGGEPRVLDLIAAAKDRSSMSNELDQAATTWAERYHLSIDRANLLRAIDLTPADRVLEIGSGCGAITRFLGETCLLVDGIEPDAERARVAATRVSDLENTQIHIVELDDVPEDPYYDVAIVTGVLEYVALGSSDARPYVEFLRKAAARLRMNGVLVLAIENALGVKYLVGSPEDHTGRAFDGLAGYPLGGKARTFSRGQLEQFFRAAGLEPTVLHAFPDFKMAQAVLSDGAVGGEHAWLGKELPRFPSPDRVSGPARVAREEEVWRSLVDGGEAQRHANSFLIVGRRPEATDRWPAERLAAFYTLGRAAQFRTETYVVAGKQLSFQRRLSLGAASRVGSLEHRPSSSTAIAGERLDYVLERLSWSEAKKYLLQWRRLVGDNPGLVDLIPANIRVGLGDDLISFDQEWYDPTYSSDDILARGVLALVHRVAVEGRIPWRELAHASPRTCAIIVGTEVGLSANGAWLSHAIEREARLTAIVRVGAADGKVWQSAYEDSLQTYQHNLPVFAQSGPPRRPFVQRVLSRITRASRVLLKGS